jgi:proteasome lid subunit RPN8/RPN11
MWLGYEELEAVERIAPHLAVIGDWHLHPSRDTEPSMQDRRAWARGCDLAGGRWVGIILAPPETMWARAQADAFITVGTQTTKFCEPLRLLER